MSENGGMTSPFGYSCSTVDSWDSDSFEDQIAATVVALYERPDHVQGSDYPRASHVDIEQARKAVAFVQHPNRLVMRGELDAPLDNIYDGVFVESFFQSKRRELDPTVYLSLNMLKRAPSIPRPFYPVAAGTPYCFIGMNATEGGALETDKHYVTVQGTKIYPCAIDANRRKRWNYTHKPPILGGLSLAENVVERVTMLANTIVDRKFQWGIQANEGHVKVELQCYHEEVKSLLYARSLPITATGRKRPILHLVSAHRRRMREGVDIEIDQFLRGTRKVEMGGAIFKVRAPEPLPQGRTKS